MAVPLLDQPRICAFLWISLNPDPALIPEAAAMLGLEQPGVAHGQRGETPRGKSSRHLEKCRMFALFISENLFCVHGNISVCLWFK